MPPHTLTSLEIQCYYQNKPGLDRVYSWNNLPNKTIEGAYAINLDEYSDIGSHWIALYSLNNDITYFDSFGVEIFQMRLNIKTNVFRKQADDSTMCGYFCLDLLILYLQERI